MFACVLGLLQGLGSGLGSWLPLVVLGHQVAVRDLRRARVLGLLDVAREVLDAGEAQLALAEPRGSWLGS